MRIVLYPGGRAGIGNTMRLARVAKAALLVRPSLHFVVLSGDDFSSVVVGDANVEVIHLRELVEFHQIRGLVPEVAVKRASAALTRCFEALRPDVLLSSRLSGYAGELIPPVRKLRRSGAKIIIGWRDLLTDWESFTLHPQEITSLYGDCVSHVVAFSSELTRDHLPIKHLPPTLQHRFAFLGYVPDPCPKPSLPTTPNIVCQIGGGSDGLPILERIFEAWTQLPREVQAKYTVCASHGRVSPPKHVAQFAPSEWISFGALDPANCALKLSLAGYNSCVESLQFAVNSIIIPREWNDDLEQSVRARLLGALSANISVVTETDDMQKSVMTALARKPLVSRLPADFFATPDILSAIF